MQVMGGSNDTVNPSFEYGGTIGEKFRYYTLNSFITTNRGLEPPTLGYTNTHNQSEKNNTYLRVILFQPVGEPERSRRKLATTPG
jgi:hypothetical protein